MAKQAEAVKTGMKTALVKALAVHVGLLLIFVVGANFEFWQSDRQPQMATPEVDIVQATAVDQAQVDAQAQRIREQREAAQRAEEQRVAEIERRAQEAEQRRQQEEAQAQRAREQAQRERAEAEAEAQRLREQAEAEERRAEEAAERRAQEEAAAEERRRAEEAERQRQEEERQRREAEEQQRAERERQLQEELAEERARRESARQQRVLSEVERYQALIRQTIQRNLLVDSSMRGQSCVLVISLARSGFVTNVQIDEGDRAVCEAGRAAALRAGTLPVSEDAEVYQEMSEIRLRIEPEFN
ncbi:cell envelope integrity protein TolA [Aliidiomarina sedimenti]|nr:cell envelope integrity protein TolA [Aliidiomarina sedimenti]